MALKIVRPFEDAFKEIMSEFGYSQIQAGEAEKRSDKITASGIAIILGLVGMLKGNIVYVIDMESAKKIVSKMMMGAEVKEIDDMEKSALSELSNMLTARAATNFSTMGITIDISTPTLMEGASMSLKMSGDRTVYVPLEADDVQVKLHIAIENAKQ